MTKKKLRVASCGSRVKIALPGFGSRSTPPTPKSKLPTGSPQTSIPQTSISRLATQRSQLATFFLFLLAAGCAAPKYGVERQLTIHDGTHPVWAVAPAINLSGEKSVDPILQSDLVVRQLSEVNNMKVIPVDRVIAVYSALRISRVESEDQAQIVCQQLGCDALVIPTITVFDPYDPPKFGASLQVLHGPGKSNLPNVDPRELTRRATPGEDELLPQHPTFTQAVGTYDAEDGSTRLALQAYAHGRHDPQGPMGERSYFLDSDKFCSFVYFTLIEQLLGDRVKPPVATDVKTAVVTTDEPK